MDKFTYELKMIGHIVGIFAVPILLLVMLVVIFSRGRVINNVNSDYSNYQTVECEKNRCKVKYYNDNNYLCYTDANISVADNYESKNIRVYYSSEYNSDYYCSFKLYEAMPYFKVELVFVIIFLIIIIAIIIEFIKGFIWYRKCYKSIIHFETHRPILIDNIEYHSKKRIDRNDEHIPVYKHKINVDVEIPEHGLTNIKGMITTFENEIDRISIVIDPNDVRYYIITDGRHLRREYDLFIEEHFGDKIDRS